MDRKLYVRYTECLWDYYLRFFSLCVESFEKWKYTHKNRRKGPEMLHSAYSFQHFNYHHHCRNIFGTRSFDVMVQTEHECWLLTSFYECDIRPKFHIKHYFSDLTALHASLLHRIRCTVKIRRNLTTLSLWHTTEVYKRLLWHQMLHRVLALLWSVEKLRYFQVNIPQRLKFLATL